MKKFLFTMLMSNDLGLLTRSLPITRELRERGHQVAFCNPAKAPAKLIADAGFENLLPEWSLYYIISGDMGSGFSRLFRSGRLRRDIRILVSAMKHMKQHSTAEFWNLGHFMWFTGKE